MYHPVISSSDGQEVGLKEHHLFMGTNDTDDNDRSFRCFVPTLRVDEFFDSVIE
jgi:hypothetical protein